MTVYKPTPEEHDAIMALCRSRLSLAEIADMRARVAEARGRDGDAEAFRKEAADLRAANDVALATLAAREAVGTDLP